MHIYFFDFFVRTVKMLCLIDWLIDWFWENKSEFEHGKFKQIFPSIQWRILLYFSGVQVLKFCLYTEKKEYLIKIKKF